MGKFYDLIQQHIDQQPYPTSEAAVARRLGVTQTTLANWRTPRKLVAKEHVVAVATLAGVRYSQALDALLEDIGYLTENQPQPTERGETG